MPDQQRTVVPDFVGTPVHIAIENAAEQRILLTSDDLDGPSLHARTWPGLYWVTTQDIPPGTVLGRWSRVVVTYAAEGDTRSDVQAVPGDPPPTRAQHAETESIAERDPEPHE